MPKAFRSPARALDNVPFVPVVAVLFGLVAAILILATPDWLLERGVAASGLPELIAAAAPPLGIKARIMTAFVSALGIAGLLWVMLTPLGSLAKPKRAMSRGSRIGADSSQFEQARHPHGPTRRPLFAESDLGAPFMSDEAIAHARDELVLETIVVDDPEPFAEYASEQFDEPDQQAPTGIPSPPVVIAGRASIAGLLDRLERALERRERRTGSSAPILPGDMAALRRALGESAVRH